jgi:hypothetical protein
MTIKIEADKSVWKENRKLTLTDIIHSMDPELEKSERESDNLHTTSVVGNKSWIYVSILPLVFIA